MASLLSAPVGVAGTKASTKSVRGRRRDLAVVLVAYAIARALLLAEAAVLAGRHHLIVAQILVPWDGPYYLQIASSGYPSHVVNLSGASRIAFFPLFPLLARALAEATHLSLSFALVSVSWIGGAVATVAGSYIVAERFGAERGRRAGLFLAVFPGSVVAGLAYADSLAVAFAVTSLLALSRRRHLLAGVLGAAASASLSLLLLPLAAATSWAAFRSRQLRPLTTPLLSLGGGAAYLAYLWARTGSPLSWWRVEHAGWMVHLSLPWQRDTAFSAYPFGGAGSAAVTIASIALAAAGLFALVVLRAPGSWLVLSVAVLAAVTFDGGAWIAPRFLFDGFPLVLATGAVIPRRLFPFVALVALAALVLLLAAYTPPNRVFLNP